LQALLPRLKLLLLPRRGSSLWLRVERLVLLIQRRSRHWSSADGLEPLARHLRRLPRTCWNCWNLRCQCRRCWRLTALPGCLRALLFERLQGPQQQQHGNNGNYSNNNGNDNHDRATHTKTRKQAHPHTHAHARARRLTHTCAGTERYPRGVRAHAVCKRTDGKEHMGVCWTNLQTPQLLNELQLLSLLCEPTDKATPTRR
jgi:hypothetical protein